MEERLRAADAAAADGQRVELQTTRLLDQLPDVLGPAHVVHDQAHYVVETRAEVSGAKQVEGF